MTLCLRRLPPMGYNTWYDYECANINATNVMAVADKMVELGLLEAGYNYVNIDDCWAVGRDANGTLLPDPVAFPDGMKAVADYVHSKVIDSLIVLSLWNSLVFAFAWPPFCLHRQSFRA